MNHDFNTTVPPKKRQPLLLLLVFVLLSLLLHALLTFCVVEFGFKKRIQELITAFTKQLTPEQKVKHQQELEQKRQAFLSVVKKLKKPKDDGRLAQLRAPLSNFGWVTFDDPPKQAQEAIIPATTTGEVGQAPTSYATEQEEQSPAAPVLADATVKERIEQIKSAQTKMAAYDQAEVKTPDDGPGENVTRATPDLQATPSDVSDRINQIKEMQTKMASYQQTGETSSSGQTTTMVRGAPDSSDRPRRNIIALTKGFIEKQRGQAGTDLVDRDGDPTKRPSKDELKYLSYESKVTWCLQAAWKNNFYHRRWAKRMEGNAVIEFTIDENGNVTNCTLLQSSGHPELDTMILQNTKMASPLPPLPKHFGTTQYKTGRIIYVHSSNVTF